MRTRVGVGLAAVVASLGVLVAAQGENPTVPEAARAGGPAVVRPLVPAELGAPPTTLDPLPSTTTSAPAGGAGAAAEDPVPSGASRPAPARRPGGRQPTGHIEIPAIGLSHATYEGIDLATINHGPSHWPGTPLPGQRGNTVFPGHRTTYTRPFWDIDRLKPGDEVIFSHSGGRFVYRVTDVFVVNARDTWIVNQTPDATFTIFACHPKGSAKQRYVAKGRLVSQPSPAPPSGSASGGGGGPAGAPPPSTTTTTTPQNRDLVGGLLG